MIDAYASERHFLAHLAPVWLALPPAERGIFYVAGALADQGGSEGVGPLRVGYPEQSARPLLVASFQDHVSGRARGRPIIYLEHGAGQTYRTEDAPHPSYSGSPGHDGTILFLCPSRTVANRWALRYPAVPAVAVGAPKLDAFHGDPLLAGMRRSLCRPLCDCHQLPGDRLVGLVTSVAYAEAIRQAHPVVAISFHSAVRLVPETFGAWEEYSAALGAACAVLRARGATLLGHAHPRLWGRLGPRWQAMGVEPVRDFAEILGRADLYCVDNSSTLYEAASCGIPTVALNASWFRRDVHHGLRFWDLIPGVQCDSASELPDAVEKALEDPPELRAQRQRVVAAVYVATDGRASERAAAAIRAVLT